MIKIETRQHDAHIANWLRARFGLNVQWNDWAPGRDDRFIAIKGEWDLDIPYATGSTIYAAALEYTSCFDCAAFDVLNAIEIGE